MTSTSAGAAQRVASLVREAGSTYAEQAGIKLADKPRPLYQLLVLSVLLAHRISSHIAVSAARELFHAGGSTPRGMLGLSWQQRVDALGRAHYVRYDESTATRLGDGAQLVIDRWRGDLRRLAAEAEHDPVSASALLREVPGIGPLGADIFLREAQAVWSWLRPFADDRARRAARRVGLPASADGLARLARTKDLSALSAALVRSSRDGELRRRLTTSR